MLPFMDVQHIHDAGMRHLQQVMRLATESACQSSQVFGYERVSSS